MTARIICLIFSSLVIACSVYAQPVPKLVIESGDGIHTSSDGIFFSTNNRFLALATAEEIRIFDLRTGFLLKKIRGENNYTWPQFSADFSEFKFTRLRNNVEKDDQAFVAVQQTFSGEKIYQQPYDKNDYGSFIRPVNGYIFSRQGRVLRFFRAGTASEDTIRYTGNSWALNAHEDKLMIASKEGWQHYYIIGLTRFDTLQKIDFSRIKPGEIPPSEVQSAREYGYPFMSIMAIAFHADDRYLLLQGELWSKGYAIKIYDRVKDSVVFSKTYPKVDYDKDIFFHAINFSPVTGVVTLPADNGLSIYNIYSKDSAFIPLKKQKLTTNADLSADGKAIIINDHERVVIYNSSSLTPVFDKALSSTDVYVNPRSHFVYVSSSTFSLDKQTLLYDTRENKVMEAKGVAVKKISPDGKLLYGIWGYRDYLFDEYLQPVREINNCTPYTKKVKETGQPGWLLMQNDNMCDFRNNTQAPAIDFSLWNINKLTRINNDMEGYTFSFNDIEQYAICDNKIFFSNSPFSLNTVPDTAAAKTLEERYGYMRVMKGRYMLFFPNNFPSFDDKNWGDTVTVLSNAKTILAHFPLKKLSPAAFGLDTINKHILVLAPIAGLPGNTLSVWSYTGIKLKEFNIPHALQENFNFSEAVIDDIAIDNAYVHFVVQVSIAGNTKRRMVVNLTTGRSVLDIIMPADERCSINLNARKCIYPDSSNFLHSVDFATGKHTIKKVYPIATSKSLLLGLIPAGQYRNFEPSSLLFPQAGRYTLFLQNWLTGDTMCKVPVDNYFTTVGVISNDGKWFAFSDKDSIVCIVNVKKQQVKRLTGHSSYIVNICFDSDNKKLVSSSIDGTNKLWSLDSLKEIVTLVNLREGDYLISSPDGYYTCTKGAQTRFGFLTGGSVLTSQQLDLIYNRPDLLLQKIGCSDTLLRKAYFNAWKKRLNRSGAHVNATGQRFSAPVLTIANVDSIGLVAKNKMLKLVIKATDSLSVLQQLNIRVNDCPVYGVRGGDLSVRGIHSLDTTVFVTLSDGLNKIEASVINAEGTESFRMPLSVNYLPADKQKMMTYFVGIGIDRFEDSRHNLGYSTKDIRDLAAALKNKYNDSMEIDTLFNEKVNVDNVKQLKTRLLNTGVNDKVIIAYSGHGLLTADFDYYLSTYNVNFAHPEKGGLPYEGLEELIDSIPARKKLVLIDACYSGEVDRDELVYINSLPDTGHLKKGARPVADKSEASRLGLKSTFELMQELFGNVGKSTGATIISAAGGTQFAQEQDNLKNGVFTFSLLEYTRQHPHATVREVKEYINKRVPFLTGGLQQPTTRTENRDIDWVLW